MEKLAASIRLCVLDSSLPACKCLKGGWKAIERTSVAVGKKALPELKLFTSSYSILGTD